MKMDLFEKALEMPSSKRVVFPELLFASIEREEENVRQSWILEVKKELNKGKTKLFDFEKLYRKN